MNRSPPLKKCTGGFLTLSSKVELGIKQKSSERLCVLKGKECVISCVVACRFLLLKFRPAMLTNGLGE